MSLLKWLRHLLIGDTSWLFLLEIIYRAAIVYVVLLVAMRIMGKRMAAQLGIGELAVILMLGAAISAPIQMPTQGLLPAVVILGTVAALQRGVSVWSFHRRKVELGIHGDVRTIVLDGRLLLDALRQTKLSRDMVLSQLRSQRVWQLGELRRVYLEPAGGFSIIRYAHATPGLSVSPSKNGKDWPARPVGQLAVCGTCGGTWQPGQTACPWCGHDSPAPACAVHPANG
jgi:uncharacterized membrane protein YcaP (DUF421 family)